MAKQRAQLTIKQILRWADAHYERTREWPTRRSGPVHGAPAERWGAIDGFLQRGSRGLPGGLSLAERLTAARGPRQRKVLKPLTMKQVLAWVDEHHQRTGRWPTKRSDPVRQAPGQKWESIDRALIYGFRGFPGGSSLARLLARERNVRNSISKPRLTMKKILAWADAHHKRTGRWPALLSGRVHEAPEENWAKVGDTYLLADRLAPEVMKAARVESYSKLRPVSSGEIKGLVCAHPFRGLDGANGEWDFDVPMLPGGHVTDDAGTDTQIV